MGHILYGVRGGPYIIWCRMWVIYYMVEGVGHILYGGGCGLYIIWCRVGAIYYMV